MSARHGIRTAALVALVVACAVPAGAQQPRRPGVDRNATPAWSTDAVVEVSLAPSPGDRITGPLSQQTANAIGAADTYAGNLKPYKASGLDRSLGNNAARNQLAAEANELEEALRNRYLQTRTIRAAGQVNTLLNLAEPLGYALEGDYSDATKSLVQNGLQEVTSTASASAFGAFGVWVGAPAGPVGMVVGGLVGSTVGAVVGSLGYDAVAKETVQTGLNAALDETPAADKKRRADEAWASRQDFLRKKAHDANPAQAAAADAQEQAARADLDQAVQNDAAARQRAQESGDAVPTIGDDCTIVMVHRSADPANVPDARISYTVLSGRVTAKWDFPLTPAILMHCTFTGTVNGNVITGNGVSEYTMMSGKIRVDVTSTDRQTILLRADGTMQVQGTAHMVSRWECMSDCPAGSPKSGRNESTSPWTSTGTWAFGKKGR